MYFRNCLLGIENPVGCQAVYWLLSLQCRFICHLQGFSSACWLLNWKHYISKYYLGLILLDTIYGVRKQNNVKLAQHWDFPGLENVNIYLKNLDHYITHRLFNYASYAILLCFVLRRNILCALQNHVL